MRGDAMGYLEDDIRRNVKSRQLVVIAGAGISVGASRGAPTASWTGLLGSGIDRCVDLSLIDDAEGARLREDIAGGSADRLILAAELIARALGAPSREYALWLAETVGRLSVADAGVVSVLARMGCRIATTNYDDVLEAVTGFEPVTWTEPARAQQWFNGENPRQILHLHGHWRRPESVVLGIRSYEDVLRSPFAQALLRALPFQYSLLFVGFGAGLSDPNFGPFLAWLDDVLRDTTNRHYRLVLKSEARATSRSGPPKVFLVPYGDGHAALGPFLAGLLPPPAAPDPPGAPAPAPTATARRRFFLSYRHGGADQQLAEQLHQHLEAAGHDVSWDVDLRAGDDWARLLRSRIEQADFFVPLLSRESVDSEMVLDEVRTAWRGSKRRGHPRILPVRVGYDRPFGYELNLYLGRLHWVDHAADGGDEGVAGALLDAARGIEPLPVLEPAAPAAAPSPPPPVVGDRSYVETHAHRRVMALAGGDGVALTIVAPRAFGKTRLLLRYLEACRARGSDVIHVDLNAFESACLDSYDAFLTALASEVLTALRLYLSPPKISRQSEMKIFMQRDVLAAARRPVVLALDHLHRIIGRAYQNDFFAMLRSWQNDTSARTPDWTWLRMALVVATDPSRLIVDVRQSPFNVGERVDLRPLTRAEAEAFNAQQAAPLDAGQLDELYELLAGHPHLTRRSYEALASGTSFDEFRATAATVRGPLGDHLRALWAVLAKRPELLAAFEQASQSGAVADPAIAGQLCATGILVESGARYDPANLLYARFFLRQGAPR